jgi:hypothetical protein
MSDTGWKQGGFAACRYPEQVKRLFNVCLDNGILYSAEKLQQMWISFSHSRFTGWLTVDPYTDDQLLQVILFGDIV